MSNTLLTELYLDRIPIFPYVIHGAVGWVVQAKPIVREFDNVGFHSVVPNLPRCPSGWAEIGRFGHQLIPIAAQRGGEKALNRR